MNFGLLHWRNAISGNFLMFQSQAMKIPQTREIWKQALTEMNCCALQISIFTYTPRKYLFVKKKLTPEDEEICDLRIPHLQIEKGKIVGVIGDNGSGKSTFLRCLCGLEKDLYRDCRSLRQNISWAAVDKDLLHGDAGCKPSAIYKQCSLRSASVNGTPR